jgi:hypothetical protein
MLNKRKLAVLHGLKTACRSVQQANDLRPGAVLFAEARTVSNAAVCLHSMKKSGDPGASDKVGAWP